MGKDAAPRAYRFQLDLEIVDMEGRLNGDVDRAFGEAVQGLLDKPSSVLARDIEYQVMSKAEDILALLATRAGRRMGDAMGTQ